MSVVAVLGVAGRLGTRFLDLLADDPEVERVIGVDVVPPDRLPAKLDFHRADIVNDDLKGFFEGADSVVLVASADGPGVEEGDAARVTVEGTRRALEAASGAGVEHVVLLSTAMVYGAWPDNPVPLTEDAALRPNPGFACAARRAEAERLVAEWDDAHPAATATILRPTVILAEGSTGWLARALRAAAGIHGNDEPPSQYVHADDVASAIALACQRRLPGVYNVAPEGWIPGDQVRALAGPRPRLRLPERVAARVAERAWRMRLGPIPPGLIPYTVHPWVVASDRLRAEGWQARDSNEEAFVVGHQPGPLTGLSPKRRQEIALGGMVVGIAGVVALAVRIVSRRRRRGARSA